VANSQRLKAQGDPWRWKTGVAGVGTYAVARG